MFTSKILQQNGNLVASGVIAKLNMVNLAFFSEKVWIGTGNAALLAAADIFYLYWQHRIVIFCSEIQFQRL